MKHQFNKRHVYGALLNLVFVLGIIQPLQALPATVDLAKAPLANATTTSVLPNLMFILDSSGSMDWNYLPDWVDDSICKNTGTSYNAACLNSPLFQSPDVNGVYYNPEIRYLPPVKSDGTSYPSQTSWTSVNNDAYGIQDNRTTNLVNNYIDVEWCTDTSFTDCLRNDNYILPGTVNGKNYTVSHTTVASGTQKLATGSTSNPTVISNRVVGPHYYRINPGEYCDSPKLVNCQQMQGGAYTYPAPVRWCTNAQNASAITPAANSCQGLRSGNYTTIRFPTRYPTGATPATGAVAAVATFSFNESGCTDSRKSGIGSIVVNVSGGTNILNGATANNINSAANLASAVTAKGAKGGYVFTANGSTLTITAPISAGNITAAVSWTYASGSNSRCKFTPTTAQFGGYQPAKPAMTAGAGSFVRTDIVDGATYPKALGRTDCAGDTCTYNEEMTNFANWWTYYQTRMQTMKTATSLAFKSIDSRYRVGFIDIYGSNYLPIARFDGGAVGGGSVKDAWYSKLFAMNPNGGTPLRSALARVGQIYAGQKPVGSADPVQYSCQQNFALLTTDGYWNGDATTGRSPTTIGVNGLTGALVGDMDGSGVAAPMYEGPVASSNSLADVAKYYYDTDLRTSDLGNCTGSANVDVCKNNVFQSDTDKNAKQHMTTFTLGLGVNGALLYSSGYKTATSGDYASIVKGDSNWPVPVADTETAVDDLWHAAVNGQGTYFSAKDPTQLSSGLSSALTAIGAKLGAGSAAATSSLNPVAGDNFSYVASYTTVKWQGNLEERTIDLSNGNVSQAAQWCVEDTVTASCAGSITSTTSGNVTTYFCSVPNSTAATCTGGTFDGTSLTCNIPVQSACQGTMRSRINANSDTRLIKISDGATSPVLVDFTYDNLSATQKGYFTGTQLSQWSDLDQDQKNLAAGANLVAYLRGQNGFEDQGNNSVLNRLYRYREATLGDIIESQPQYDGPAKFKYTDAKYSDYITAKASAPRTIYVGANDGMLHAFNANDGTERWAYVPTPVIPNLPILADKSYATKHANYVNGSPVLADVYDSGAAKWRTILVSGLNGGGRGYFALDVTDPTQPSLLWEIDSTTESNLGYSFGYPAVVKNNAGRWVVLLTSGYNNVSPGDGEGYLFVRDALSGASIATIGTGAGSSTTPSGLAKISSYGNDPMHDATSIATYGGDLLGNVWRFDINAGTAVKIATLKDPSGAAQAVTSIPELGAAYGKRVILVGTGKYLETTDLTTNQRQTIYAITDDGTNTATLTDPRSALKQQVLTVSEDELTRTGSQNPVDLRTDRGWYVDFPDTGERVNVDPKLDSGLLVVATTVPSNTVCAPGGYSWLNYFNYLTGTIDNGVTSVKTDAPIVGINIFYTPDGQRRINIVTANNPTPTVPPGAPPPPSNLFNFQGKRVIWRELIP